MTTLSDSVEGILDAIVDAIREEVGGTLEGVQEVVRGDRARPMPALPAIWVVPQPAQWSQDEFGEESWALPVTVSALVKGDDPAEAGKLSQRLTADARAAALLARSTMRETLDVTDVTSWTFDPTARTSERNRTLFWTEATIRVTFTVTG